MLYGKPRIKLLDGGVAEFFGIVMLPLFGFQ